MSDHNDDMTDSVLDAELGIERSTTGCTEELNQAQLEVKLDIKIINVGVN